METVYKIVRKLSDSNWQSIYANTSYQVGEWATAPIGGLLAFDTLERARLFLEGRSYWHIFEAEAEDPVDLPHLCLLPFLLNRAEYVCAVWTIPEKELLRKQEEHAVPIAGLSVWPSGTLAFKRVKLLEEIRE
jgi:hypothetical protein